MTMRKDVAIRRTFMKENIEQIVTHYLPNDRCMQNKVRNANGFVGNGFVCVRMPNKDRTRILNALFGKKGW